MRIAIIKVSDNNVRSVEAVFEGDNAHDIAESWLVGQPLDRFEVYEEHQPVSELPGVFPWDYQPKDAGPQNEATWPSQRRRD